MKITILTIATILCTLNLFSQTKKYNDVRIMFYNAENYFDPINDSLTRDDEFTPEGARHWSWKKFNKKKSNLFKVIAAFNKEVKPDFIGLCEIENRFVLNKLLYDTPLGDNGYKIVHKESPDHRGIDVALFYNKNTIWEISEQFIPVHFPGQPNHTTRDILYFKGLLANKDTIHIFVNHWPSKYGGALATIPFRAQAAKTLKKAVDSIISKNKNANIVITGDFNDTPSNVSVYKHLGAVSMKQHKQLSVLNVDLPKKYKGTHKYHGEWSMLDLFIVSKGLLNKNSKTYTSPDYMRIGQIDLLLEPDEKYTGQRPNRTFLGFTYHGGFSDHLPISLDLKLQ